MVLDCELNVHEPANRQGRRQQTRVVAHRLDVFRINSHRRQNARRVARVYARLFEVLVDRRDDAGVFVCQRVHVKLCGAFEELIDQDGTIRRKANRVAHVFLETLFVVNHRHRASAKDITRTNQHRGTNLFRNTLCLVTRRRHAVFRLRYSQLREQRAESFAIFGEINRVSRRYNNRHAGFVQTHRKIQRRLSAKLDDHSFRFLDVDDVHHVFEGQRFEIETIGSVVIGRNSFRIAVDHDGLEAGVAQRERGVTTAVVKLDSLPDAVWPGAEDHDLARVGGRCFAFRFVSRIKIGRERFKLGAASVDALVDWNNAEAFAVLANFVFRFAGDVRKPAIRERHFLELAQQFRRNVFELLAFNSLLNLHHVLELFEEPRVNARETIDLGDGPAMLQRVSNVREALRIWPGEFALQFIIGNAFESQRLHRFERTKTFEQSFLKRSANRHHFADRLHLRAEYVLRFAKLFEVPLRNLGYDVIDGRFKRCRRLLRDVVRNFIERVTHRELRRDLGDGKASRF